MRLAWLVLVAGCGRVAFDDIDPRARTDASESQPCTPVGHDEDRDLVDDACDVCPHRPDPMQVDTDGDRVGDACDPNPLTAGERIVFFDPFVAARPEWRFGGPAQVYNGEQLVVDARASALVGHIDAAPTSGLFAYGMHLEDGASGFRQLTLFMETGLNATYFAELYGNQSLKLKLTYTLDGSTYPNIATADLIGPLQYGDVILELTHAPRAVATTSWSPMPTVEADVPAGLTAPISFGFVVRGVQARVDWFVQIHTGP